MEKKCDHCKKYKGEEGFNWKFKSLGIRHKTCRECMAEFNRNYFQGDAHDRHLAKVKERKDAARQVAREFAYHYLLSHPCEECGESDVRVLEFHHTEGRIWRLLLWYLEVIRLNVSSPKLINAQSYVLTVTVN